MIARIREGLELLMVLEASAARFSPRYETAILEDREKCLQPGGCLGWVWPGVTHSVQGAEDLASFATGASEFVASHYTMKSGL
jgi:hypothetical protein